MINLVTDRGRKIYKCEVCGFGYLTNDIANKCQAFCTEHGACSLEITKHAVVKG